MERAASRVDKLDRLDYVVFDLDLPESRNGLQAIRVAHLVRRSTRAFELQSYVKTSGADGIHVLVPITRRYCTRRPTSPPSAYVGLKSHPGLVTTEWLKRKRRGALVDHRQNGHGKTIGFALAGAAGGALVLDAALASSAAAAARTSGCKRRWRGSRSMATCSSLCSGADRSWGRALRSLRVRGRRRDRLRPERACRADRRMAASWRSLVHEAEETVGGGVRSAELTLPGFLHDVCSAIHPLGRYSPFFRDLELPVEWVEPPPRPLTRWMTGRR